MLFLFFPSAATKNLQFHFCKPKYGLYETGIKIEGLCFKKKRVKKSEEEKKRKKERDVNDRTVGIVESENDVGIKSFPSFNSSKNAFAVDRLL